MQGMVVKLGKIKLEGCSWARMGLVSLETLKAWVQRNDFHWIAALHRSPAVQCRGDVSGQ